MVENDLFPNSKRRFSIGCLLEYASLKNFIEPLALYLWGFESGTAVLQLRF